MLIGFFTALQFLTIIRLQRNLPFTEEALGRAATFFPMVGLILGGLLWLCDKSFFFLPPSFRNLLLVAILAALSRGLHLDGLADTVDGLLGSADRQRSLAIMKDSAVGTFGVLAVFLVLLLKLRSLDLLAGGYRGVALLVAPVLGRWSCVVMAYSSRPARTEGLGWVFVRGVHFREFGLASVLALAVTFTLVEVLGLVVFVPLAALTLLFTLYCHRRLGGVTGDTLGAMGEIAETLTFSLFALVAQGVPPR
ncbi:MAG: adenosylcobinamide-GDP ribazoletransferase [Deltaproteobacteria bacterium]|nr:adenosylcobinamide-GDP ribazoletransferase [Deltaproteobacteria bacterium]